ncbi:hypothetical protein L9F63_020527 [Diploptera punctata]|uniref:Ionotropic receptor n=1 Tax=Diploptera punctata TaxID=6984 RepID=A0AAD7ZSJ9_DIPPU|nr:hypothetical protein L9F63_020527 [Diploptera punctata]
MSTGYYRTEYYRPKNGTWGVALKNGSWDGMIGEIISNKVDVGVSDFLMTSERMAVIDYLPPLIDTGQRTYVFIRKSNYNHLEWDAYIFPFTSQLWITVAATLLLITTCSLVNWVTLRGKLVYHSFLDNISVMIGIFLQQGDSALPRYGSARVIYITAHMVLTVMAAAYSGALVSFLSARHYKLPFTSFQGLLDGRYRLGVLQGSAQFTYLYDSVDPVLRNVYSRMIQPELDKMPVNITMGMERVCKLNKYSFMVELDNAQGVMRKLHCDIVKLPQTVIPATMSIIVPKKFPYRSILGKNVMRMRRTGILQRLRNLNIPPRKEVHDIQVADLHLGSVLPILLLLLAGIVTSSFLLLLEMLFNLLYLFCRRRWDLFLARKIKYPSNRLYIKIPSSNQVS